MVFLKSFNAVFDMENKNKGRITVYYSVLPNFEYFPVPNSRVFDKIS